MTDESRARLYREIGLLLETAQPETALNYLERALTLNLNVGVQGNIKKLRKQLNLLLGNGKSLRTLPQF
ncbi:terminase [Ursidibacter sp. B-7004-1]